MSNSSVCSLASCSFYVYIKVHRECERESVCVLCQRYSVFYVRYCLFKQLLVYSKLIVNINLFLLWELLITIFIVSFLCLLLQTLVSRGGESVDLVSKVKEWLNLVCQLLKADPHKVREGELAAFLTYAIAYPHNFLPVIDSYSVRW